MALLGKINRSAYRGSRDESILNAHSFFVVEDTVLHTTQSLAKTVSREAGDEGLVTRTIVNEFWSMAQDEALAVLRSNCVSRRESVCMTYTGIKLLVEEKWPTGF